MASNKGLNPSIKQMSKRKGSSKSSGENKRRQEDGNSRQLDPVFGQYRALPVTQEVYDSVTPDTVPEDGETYLAMVRKQAEEGCTVRFMTKDIVYDEEKSTPKGDTPKPEATGQNHNENLTQFKDAVLEEFQKQRDSLPEVGVMDIPVDFVFPENFTEWRSYVMSHQPSLNIISNLDLELTLKLVVYATRWLAANTPAQISPWIYSLLVRVPQVLTHTDVSVVRELGSRAKKLHDRPELPETTRVLCATILAIVGGFFGQGDLLMSS